MQQTFLSAYRSMLGGSTPREPAAWLATIARNECWSRARSRMREPLAEPDHEGAESAISPDALTEAIAGQELKTLCRALRRLPRPQREALLLRELSGYTYTEVAELLGVSERAVDSLLVRARRRLKELRVGLAAWLPLPASLRSIVARLLEGGSGPMVAKATAAAAIAVAVTGATGGSVPARGVGPSHREAVAALPVHSATTTVQRAPTRARPTPNVRRSAPRPRATSHPLAPAITSAPAPASSTPAAAPTREPAPQPEVAPPAPVEAAAVPETPDVPATAASDKPTPAPAEPPVQHDSAPAPAPTQVTSAAEAPLAAATEIVEETAEIVEAVAPVDVPSVSVPATPKVAAPSLPKPLH